MHPVASRHPHACVMVCGDMLLWIHSCEQAADQSVSWNLHNTTHAISKALSQSLYSLNQYLPSTSQSINQSIDRSFIHQSSPFSPSFNYPINNVCQCLLSNQRRRHYLLVNSRTRATNDTRNSAQQTNTARSIEAAGVRGHQPCAEARPSIFRILGAELMTTHATKGSETIGLQSHHTL